MSVTRSWDEATQLGFEASAFVGTMAISGYAVGKLAVLMLF